jgi:hypothetical protein
MPQLKPLRIISLLIALAVLPTLACYADTIDLGFVQLLAGSDTTAGFNISNVTGLNASPPGDSSFPVVTSVPFTDPTLIVNFADGSQEEFGTASGYFSLASDGLSYIGAQEADFLTKPIGSAFLVGTFGVTGVSLNDTMVAPEFVALVADPSGILPSGAFGLIEGATPVSAAPEPGLAGLAACGLALVFLRRRLSR